MATKKKTTKKKPASPPAKKAPAEMAYFWDSETQDAWRSMHINHRRFFLAWIRNGFKGDKAYQEVYTSASAATARANASYILSKPNVMRIRRQIVATPNWDMELAHQTFVDAMHSDVMSERLAGAKAHTEAYDKMKGRQPPPDPDKDSAQNITNVQTQINILVTKSMANVKHLLNNKNYEKQDGNEPVP